MINEILQLLIDGAVPLISILLSAFLLWLVGRVVGLWELIKDENVKRLARRGLVMLVDSNIDEFTEDYIEKTSEKLSQYVESKLKSKGFNVELDDVVAVVNQETREFFQYLRNQATVISLEYGEDDDDENNEPFTS